MKENPESEAMAELRAETADPRILVYAKKKRFWGWLWVALFVANCVVSGIAGSASLSSVACIAWFVLSVPATLTTLALWVYYMVKRKNAMEAVWKAEPNRDPLR